jgi:hypothetical protein
MPAFRLTRWLWLLTGLLALVTAGLGVARPAMYEELMPATVLPGMFTQDLLVVALSAVLLGLAGTTRPTQVRRQVAAHGILGFLFYAYGIYAIERVYTGLYPAYLALFGASLFVLVQSLAAVPSAVRRALAVPAWMRRLAAGYALAVAAMFTVLWLGQLLPLLESGTRVDVLYSIYVIDLSFVMPALAVAAVLALRRHPVGLMGLPALFVLGAGILSPLALAELLKPGRYGQPFDAGGFWLYAGLSAAFVGGAAAYLAVLRVPGTSRDRQ